MMQRVIFILLNIFILSGCDSFNKEKTLEEKINGTWLVLYPNEKLYTEVQVKVYPKLQDSLVNELGLKIIYLGKDKTAYQVDSMYLKKHGSWNIINDKSLVIKNAGGGLNNFSVKILNLKNDTLVLREEVNYKEELIVVDWHLKRVNDSFAYRNLNNWRINTKALEDSQVVAEKLKAMILFSANYFKLLSNESVYFIPDRVPLPFNYYSGGIGIADTLKKNFKQCFFNDADADKAHKLLIKKFNNSRVNFPNGKNFTEQYSKFFFLFANNF